MGSMIMIVHDHKLYKYFNHRNFQINEQVKMGSTIYSPIAS